MGLDRVNDSVAMRADQHVAAATARRAPNVTAHLVAVDARLARTAVADGERAVARLEAHNRSVNETAL